MKNFGKTEQAVYEFIKKYIEQNSFPPSVREIGEALSLKSTATVHFHLKSLQERGLIAITPNRQRAITLVNNDNSAKYMEVPLLGTVAAGSPIYAYDDILEYFPFPKSLLHGADKNDVFLLTVEGESMMDAGILSGDMILVHKGIAVENGDIAVVRIFNESATVKRFYRSKNGDTIRLQPENASMEPIIVNCKDAVTVGKVIGVFRKYL